MSIFWRLALDLLGAVILESLGTLALDQWDTTFQQELAAHLLLTVVVFALASALMLGIVRPLKELARAADETTIGQQAPLTPSGPPEVRRVATAFAAMQSRLLELVEDNTQTLVAASHDLRTPLHRMGLRAEMLDDDQIRRDIQHDLKEMQSFVDGALDYIQTGADEAPRLIDIATLIATITDDAQDQGIAVTFAEYPSLNLMARKTTVTRMVQNLLKNSHRHARHIRVTLSAAPDGFAVIQIDDDGPGIAPELRERCLKPFQQGDAARSWNGREGIGLGLAFVDRAAANHGGALALDTSDLGGLRATITLADMRPAA